MSVLLAGGINAAPVQCLVPERGVGDTEIAYGPRGNRCEGVFVNPTAGGVGLQVVGYQLSPPRFDLLAKAPIPLQVERGGFGQAVSLRVSSLKWRVHYQMDTSALNANGAFAWPTELVRHPKLTLGPEDVAAMACTQDCSLAADELVFPVTVGPHQRAPEPLLTLLSSVELSEVLTTVVHQGQVVAKNRSLGATYLPAGRAIRVPLGSYLRVGENDVSIVGIDRSGGEGIASVRLRLVLPRP